MNPSIALGIAAQQQQQVKTEPLLQTPQEQQQQQQQANTRVPAFLNKLYALVNDPETDEYVHWNDTGTAFVIPNSQLMAENVLPRSFKTINFASFVRQLNMYGFHKVPHLNDGALHTESAPEVWEFTNPSFTRDDPDLADIVRKKNEAEKARSAKRQGSPEAKPRPSAYPAIEAPPNPTTTPRDMAVVYEEIRNIKRHQNAVIGELKRLKTDNDALWTEAAEARARYDQQQTTINKMLKFLSTVFSPNKSNAAGSLSNRNRGLLTGPSAFEELSDDSVLTPEAQETGARELSNLFGGQQPILPTNAGDAAWWQNLVKNTGDGGLLNLSSDPGYVTQNDILAPYEPPPTEMTQHRNSLAAMEHAVHQTDQSIGRISNVLGINDWDTYNFSNPQNTDGISFDAFAQPTIATATTTEIQPEYRFEDFIRSNIPPPFPELSNEQDTDENGTILDQNEEDTPPQPEAPDTRFESLSREATPKANVFNAQYPSDEGNRKRTRSQTAATGLSPAQKRTR